MTPQRPVMETVCVVGLGYIGLPSATVIAQSGSTVTGVDVNPAAVDAINQGRVPFVEEGLETAVAGVVAQGRLKAQTDVPHAQAYIVAVPTPFTEGHRADLSYIEAAARNIAPQLTGGELVILESTSPPGATERMAEVIFEERDDLTQQEGRPNTVHFAHCPERVLPGRIMVEMVENDRIIGGITPKGAELARDLYAQFCRAELLLTDARTAEMAKLTENAFRDVNIAFANELSLIADHLKIDVWELIELANHHPRVDILQPGPGVGGHCIAVDPWFIVSADQKNSKLISMARQVNDSKPERVIEKVIARAERLREPVVAALGIAFKANIDDLRESPSRNIVGDLAARLDTGRVLVVEPNIDELPGELAERENVELAELDGAVEQADIVLLLVDHDQFKTFDRDRLQEKIVIDTKGLWR
ncbi:UDP-N-acetyl-D-mannosamine dehydrogenase [Nesterenkonia aerolata]|uniref:UDP-N-acetyl-D-mannosamine dehydrogenase n=1 Tax=Nesterenkonia aerolata TaxID=3074079 RepID=A0ABU2DPK7_9MICC|nr:UDP-N-acetyl-D-mannosamine dehydrogenase [Nesterenkonia sp. LY-0111]MDR8018444.1 UDP-N-acetyl-D-mannosamine dehydrogenase [Nesterenkonia sp. LY-0111]